MFNTSFLTKYNFWQSVAFVALLGITIFYSLYKLTESPPTWFDEGIYIQVAESISHSGLQSVQVAPNVTESTGHVTGGYPFLAPTALSLKVFGNSLLAARVPMIVFVFLTVLMAVLLMYRLYGIRIALFSMLLLSTFPLLYGNGKNVLGEVPGMLYVLLSLYFLWQIERHQFKGARWYMLAGLFGGLASATKPIFFLLPLAIGIVFLCTLRTREWQWKNVALGTFAFILPLLLWVYLQFGSADALSSVLFHYANPYAKTSLLHTIGLNLLRFFKEVTPLYSAALMGVWVLAMGVRVYRKNNILVAEWSAFVFAILIMFTYLRTEGWYRYFFEAMILALLFLPSALQTLAGELERYTGRIKLVWLTPVLLILLGVMQLYQLNYSSWVAEHYNSTQTATLADYFAKNPQVGSVLVYNVPEIVPFLHTGNYYQYFDIEPTGALAYGKENIPLLIQGVPDEVITSPSMFEQHSDLFLSYKQSDTIGGYLILSR